MTCRKVDDMSTALRNYPISHGGIRPVSHRRLGVEINGQTCIRYLRFLRPVRLDRLELGLASGGPSAPMGGSGRWVPNVPTHPAHLTISVLEEQTGHWRTIEEVELAANPAIGGEGLSQDMSAEEMTAILDQAKKDTRHVIDLSGLYTDHLRVECDREHPVWPSHGECNGGPFNVPFASLNPLQAFGEEVSRVTVEPIYNPLLALNTLRPEAPPGMEVVDMPQALLYRGERISVGFSLRRPMLMHLGWDAFGRGHAGENRLAHSLLPADRTLQHDAGGGFTTLGGLSGPLVRTLQADCGAHLWTGEVSVEGNCVSYRNLRAVDGLCVDAVFTVEPDRLLLELTQRCEQDMPVLEFEAWRLAWDLRTSITGAAAMPTLLPGRNGDVHLPMLWAGSGPGCLSCHVVAGAEHGSRLQVESYRLQNAVTGGLLLGDHPGLERPLTVPAGTRRATFELAVTSLVPACVESTPEPRAGVATRWAAPFACFRPELGGFSDHSASVNCHTNQADAIEVIVFTRKPRRGPDPLDLARFTIGRALMDGGGYGYWRNLYMDSDPQLVMSAGRIHQVSPDLDWLREIEPGLREAVCGMLAALDEGGLTRCRDLSGNTGSHRWSTNCMDVVGFGHRDAYVNALSYRAFRNGAALLADLGQRELADQCQRAAAGIHRAYAASFVNSETGWVAGWRSRDGQLHDYAFLAINGLAIALGLLEDTAARQALLNLEELREQKGVGSARLGLPLNLLPIHPGDHMLSRLFGAITPTFENYTDGSLSGWGAGYYLRGLSLYGLDEQAQRLARELDEAYAWGVFDGGNFSGTEFHSWEGMCNGYEGTMGCIFGALYAIAIEQGALAPLEPEWWPPGG